MMLCGSISIVVSEIQIFVIHHAFDEIHDDMHLEDMHLEDSQMLPLHFLPPIS